MLQSVQPFDPDKVVEIVAGHAGLEGPLLPILHAVQVAFGHVPDEATAIIAGALNLTRAEVHGVVTFYHDFRRRPAGEHVVKLCRAEACQARGGAAIQFPLKIAHLGAALPRRGHDHRCPRQLR